MSTQAYNDVGDLGRKGSRQVVVIGRLLAACALVALVGVASAQQTQPADAPSDTLQATVVSVTGQTERLTSAEGQAQTWAPLEAGQVLDEDTIIRTGLRSGAVLRLADRGEVQVESCTKIGLGEFRRQGDLVRAQLGMKYGRMTASVDASAGANDVRISTPVATLSVRGSRATIGYSSDYGMQVQAAEGKWNVKSGSRSRQVTAGEQTNSQLTPSIVLFQNTRDVLMSDTFGGVTDTERQIIMLGDNSPGSLPGQTGTDTPVTVPQPPELPQDHIIIGI